MNPMKELVFKVSFATPAFLGNAEQQAQWRTPPFKALIRQWWRVVKAPRVACSHTELLRSENTIFGAASNEANGGSHRSTIRLRLTSWQGGMLTKWPAGEPFEVHREVGETGRKVGTELYLGFGPLEYDGKAKATQFSTIKSSGKTRTAIDTTASAEIRLKLPSAYAGEILEAIQLAAWFGTVGSRSRNGWGALQISGEGIEGVDALEAARLTAYTRSIDECLKLDWPHAIGKDERGPLVWTTASKGSWREVMKELARLKIAFRTQPEFSLEGVPPGRFAKRHVIAYPITNHPVSGPRWGTQGRMANQVRFKVARTGSGFSGVIVHLPCAMPRDMAKEAGAQAGMLESGVWRAVHRVLDSSHGVLARVK